MLTRCSHDAHMMLTRCSHGSRTVLRRCSHDAHTMLTRFGSRTVLRRCSHDAHTVPARCSDGAHMMLTRFPHDAQRPFGKGVCMRLAASLRERERVRRRERGRNTNRKRKRVRPCRVLKSTPRAEDEVAAACGGPARLTPRCLPEWRQRPSCLRGSAATQPHRWF